MEQIQNIVSVLNANASIDYKTKSRLTTLIQKFNKRFPDISLENLSKRIATLEFKKGSKYAYKDAMQYINRDNQIIINAEKLKSDEVDIDFETMKTLLAIITAKDNTFGFGDNRYLESLNKGLQEVIANNIVGNEGESDYQDEQILINIVGQSIDIDILLNCFFKNDSNTLINEVYKVCGNVEEANDFLNQANNNMKTRRQIGSSRLFTIQPLALKHFGNAYSFIMKKEVLETDNIKYPGDAELQAFLVEKGKAKVIK